ncbi:hypothetical protein [Shimia ponticola]|uniref:hypothetical protein n=1 Tax=Shimia ponticola TaxID=2582893 RepID=UPI0011BDA631|nr:hypothetical protein [Shimia ponticola]
MTTLYENKEYQRSLKQLRAAEKHEREVKAKWDSDYYRDLDKSGILADQHSTRDNKRLELEEAARRTKDWADRVRAIQEAKAAAH